MSKKLKIIYIYRQGIDPKFPDESTKYYWYSGHSGYIARKMKEYFPSILIESWRIDLMCKSEKQKKVDDILCRVYPSRSFLNLDYSIKLMKQLRRESNEYQTIVHFGSTFNLSWTLIKYFSSKGKFVSTIMGDRISAHSSKIKGYRLDKKLKEILQYYNIKKNDHIFLSSMEQIEILSKKYSMNTNQMSFGEIGLDSKMFFGSDKQKAKEKLGFDKSDKLLLFIGRLDDTRGLGNILVAFEEVQKKIDNSYLIIIGGSKGQKYYNDVQNAKNVKYYGFLDYAELPTFHQAADVSLRIDFSNIGPHSVGTNIIETLACNTPVVATTLKHLPAEFRSKFGIIPNNQEEISKAIIDILRGEKQFEKTASIINEYYSWSVLCKNMHKVYLSLVTDA